MYGRAYAALLRHVRQLARYTYVKKKSKNAYIYVFTDIYKYL